MVSNARGRLAIWGAMFALVAGLVCSTARALDAGAKAPEIALKDLSGKTIDLASLAGKVVILDFWATWCAPCREEMPELQKFYKKYHGKGLEIVGISVDKAPDGIKDFVSKLKVTFPIVHDQGHKVADKYSPPRMPSSYIVDRKGVVRYVHGGYRAGDAAKFEKEIQELLAK